MLGYTGPSADVCRPGRFPRVKFNPKPTSRDPGWSVAAGGGSVIPTTLLRRLLHACAHKVRGAEWLISPAGFAPACCKVVNKMTGHALNGLTSLSIWK